MSFYAMIIRAIANYIVLFIFFTCDISLILVVISKTIQDIKILTKVLKHRFLIFLKYLIYIFY